jgi:hypothetical protein
MHRFLQSRPLGSFAKLALRSDGSLWLLAADDELDIEIQRGADWRAARRLRLCRGDRIRLDATELDLASVCAQFDTDPETSLEQTALESAIPGLREPIPLSAPREVVERPRRNPGTGQVERIKKQDNRESP